MYYKFEKKLQLGGVYKLSRNGSLIRIICTDEHEVLYDTYNSDAETWEFAGDLTKTCSYYRMPYEFIFDVAEYVRTEPLSEIEYSIFRPDLPLKAIRVKDLAWHELINLNQIEIRKLLETKQLYFDLNESILSTKLMVSPFGSRGRTHLPQMIYSSNKRNFNPVELIYKVMEIQKDFIRKKNRTNGMGIYRIGHRRGIPSFYVGEFIDGKQKTS